MRHQPASTVSRSMLLVLASISAIVVAAVGCGEETAGFADTGCDGRAARSDRDAVASCR